MTNEYIRARSPRGNVGVSGFVDSGELSAYSLGVLSGFTGEAVDTWDIEIGGVSGVQDVCVAKNPAGESELFTGTAGQSIEFTIPGAPGTPGQSQVHALVIHKDPTEVSEVNDGIDVVNYEVVSGTAATTGSQVTPSMSTIRSTIDSGSIAFVSVVGYVTIAHGASSVSLGNHVLNEAEFNSLLDNVEERLTTVEGYKVGTFVCPASTGNHSVTGLGFRPKLVEFTVITTTGTNNTGTANDGAMDASGSQYAWASASRPGANSGDSTSVNTSRCLQFQTILAGGSASLPVHASYVSMDADGFTVNFGAVDTGRTICYKARG